MSKYLSRSTLIAAYGELAHLTSNPSKQGQTQAVSGLKYAAALSRFSKENKRDFDTRIDSDRKLFNCYVGEVVALEDGYATKNFFDGFTNEKDYDIGSNLYSAGVVPDSLIAPDKTYSYPRRSGKPPLFKVKNGRLLSDSINPTSITKWLEKDPLRISFILWLCRTLEFGNDTTEENLLTRLKNALLMRYSSSFVEGLWGQSNLNLMHFHEHGVDALLTETKANIKKDDVYPFHRKANYMPTDTLANKPRNLIFFGAPGTGKSHQLKTLSNECFNRENIRRVTFYPDYTYSQFVGGYMPFPVLDKNGKPTGAITYDFVPGPFMRTYVEAIQNPEIPYLLIIEEINRANPASVFGDLFQLLDRDKNGCSTFDLAVPAEMQLYLKVFIPEFHTNDKAGTTPGDHEKHLQEGIRLRDETMRLSIPPNMYIWATMNSADQGVFPMDTAFKRRWDFRYIGVNEGADKPLDNGKKLSEINVTLTVDGVEETIVWDKLRRKINGLMKRSRINEDKFLGPFFLSPDSLGSGSFNELFKNKVLLYLFEDIGKINRGRLFRDDTAIYSDLCDQFDKEGVAIFNGIEFSDVSVDTPTKDNSLQDEANAEE